jgi:hypothetical protein
MMPMPPKICKVKPNVFRLKIRKSRLVFSVALLLPRVCCSFSQEMTTILAPVEQGPVLLV